MNTDHSEPDLRALVQAAQEAMRESNWPNAVACWDACMQANRDRPISPSWSFARAIALVSCARSSEAEEAFLALQGQHPELPYGLIGLARSASTQDRWTDALKHWDDCIARFHTHPDRASWERTRATVLERLGRWQAALECWQRLAADASDLPALLGCARCTVQLLGPTREADASIERVLAQRPGNQPALKLYARNAFLRRDFATALRRWQVYIELFPDDLYGYENAVLTARQGKDPEPPAAIVAKAPTALAATRPFQCRVLLPLHALQHDIQRGMILFRALRDDVLDWPDAAGIAQFLNDTMHYAEAVQFLGPRLERGPPVRQLVQPYLIAVLNSQGPTIFQREKTRLLKGLGETDILMIIRSLPRNRLSGAELRHLIDHVLDSQPEGAQRTLELAWIFESNSVETAEHLYDRLGASPNADERIFTRLLFARLGSMQKLSRANLGGLSWRDFEAESDSLWRELGEIAATPGLDDRSPLKDNMRQLERAATQSGRVWLNTAECYFDAASFAHWLCERLSSAEPTSVIRLGDGEGTFLPYPPDEQSFQRDDQRYIQRRPWWGETLLSEPVCDRLSGELRAAIQRADALGLPPPARLLRNADSKLRSSRGIRAVLNLFDRPRPPVRKGVVLTSCHVHSDLDQWDLHRQIFRCVEAVSTVSCHDLSTTLAEQFGVGVRRWHQMPAERRFQDMFECDAAGVSSPLDAFEAIMAEIDPLAGELVLVAAGFLGKLICDRVRERGGIAFDIGSAADYWMGYQTRNHGRDQTIFDPSSSLIEGQPFPDRFGIRKISTAKPCHSNLGRDMNLMGTAIAAKVRPPQPQATTYPLRVIGCPRCGSGYTARVLQRLGIQVGHERLGRHGICSWMHAIEDISLPYSAPFVPIGSFQTTIAFVRNPFDAIPSIMLENTRASSFDFRRFHIYRLLDVDIASARDPLERQSSPTCPGPG